MVSQSRGGRQDLKHPWYTPCFLTAGKSKTLVAGGLSQNHICGRYGTEIHLSFPERALDPLGIHIVPLHNGRAGSSHERLRDESLLQAIALKRKLRHLEAHYPPCIGAILSVFVFFSSPPISASCYPYPLCPGISPHLCSNLVDSIPSVPSLPAFRVTGGTLNGIDPFSWTTPLSLSPTRSDLPMTCALLAFCSRRTLGWTAF